jgi:hypothetical protein
MTKFVKIGKVNRDSAILQGHTCFIGSKCQFCGNKDRWVSCSACTECYTIGGVPYNFEKRKKHLLQKVSAQAKFKGVDFSIEVTDIEWVEYCPILGYKLDYWTTRKVKADTVSFDRKNPNLGYVKGNVFIISNKANSVKSNMMYEQLERLLDYAKI